MKIVHNKTNSTEHIEETWFYITKNYINHLGAFCHNVIKYDTEKKKRQITNVNLLQKEKGLK
jgi:hypothetical protein